MNQHPTQRLQDAKNADKKNYIFVFTHQLIGSLFERFILLRLLRTISLASWSLGVGLGCSFLFVVFPVWADQQGGQRPAAYLGLGAGGMQNAMGGAAVGVRNDAACGFWNPAGLSGNRGFQIETQHTFLGLGQELDYLALTTAYREKIFYGLSTIFYSAGGDLEARKGPTLVPDNTFADIQMAIFPSVAFRLSPRWSLGANLKLFVDNIGSFSGIGFGVDMGVQYRLTKTTTLGFVVLDPYSVLSYSNSNDQIFPLTVKAGIAHHEDKTSVKMNFDLEWSNDLGFRPRAGVEWRPTDILALRGGCWAGNLTSGAPGGGLSINPTGGFGLLVFLGESLIQFDYTLMPDRVESDGLMHQISVTGKFL